MSIAHTRVPDFLGEFLPAPRVGGTSQRSVSRVGPPRRARCWQNAPRRSAAGFRRGGLTRNPPPHLLRAAACARAHAAATVLPRPIDGLATVGNASIATSRVLRLARAKAPGSRVMPPRMGSRGDRPVHHVVAGAATGGPIDVLTTVAMPSIGHPRRGAFSGWLGPDRAEVLRVAEGVRRARREVSTRTASCFVPSNFGREGVSRPDLRAGA